MVGLGNPGDRYTGTRHNAGFDTVDAFASRIPVWGGRGVRVDRLDCRALTASVKVGDTAVLLAKPQTYMNLSGESVKGLVHKHGIDLSRMLVVVDDAALPLGRLRLRPDGSDGGQKGLRSIIGCLGTQNFSRLRIGIAGEHLKPEDDLADYVLSRFSKAERETMGLAIERACEAIETFVREGLEAAMTRFNRAPDSVLAP